MFVFPVLATILSAAFALATWRRGGAAMRVWSFSLVQFAIASGALTWGVALGWTPAVYRVFYLFGAVLNVGWLGLGTVWLLAPRGVSIAVTVLVAAASVYASDVALTGNLVAASARALQAELPAPRDVFSHEVRQLSRWFSIGGSVVVLAGLLWSVVRRRSRAAGLALLALGVVIVGLAGELARAGLVVGFSIALAVGIAVMYFGFARSGSARRE